MPLTAEFLKRNHGIVEFLILIHENLLVIPFTDDKACVSPTKVIHAPE